MYLANAEKDGIVVPKKEFPLQKNSLVSKWTQIDDIVNVVGRYDADNNDYLKNVLRSLDSMTDIYDSAYYQFLRGQLQLLLCVPNARRFDKQTLVIAAELYSISPAAYKMLRRSGVLALPCVTTMKRLLRGSFQDANLPPLFQKLKPQQRLVNLLFDEVKLTQTLRFSGGHILGYEQNGDNEVLATHALVLEIVCHHGGTRHILRVCPVAKLKSDDLKSIFAGGNMYHYEIR